MIEFLLERGLFQIEKLMASWKRCYVGWELKEKAQAPCWVKRSNMRRHVKYICCISLLCIGRGFYLRLQLIGIKAHTLTIYYQYLFQRLDCAPKRKLLKSLHHKVTRSVHSSLANRYITWKLKIPFITCFRSQWCFPYNNMVVGFIVTFLEAI